MNKPKIGVSACLLGRPVRYNGDSKKCEWITDTLSRQAELVSFCPEVAMGLGVPRAAMRLLKNDAGLTRLVEANSGKDRTELAERTIQEMNTGVAHLDGFILKKSSPTCGLERVKVYDSLGIPFRNGIGLFASRMIEAYPLLPVIEEGRLVDPEQRDRFLCQVYSYSRLKKVRPSIQEIQGFHRSHKLLLLEHSEKAYARLGNLAANLANLPAYEVLASYQREFMAALKHHQPTARTRTNVLQHAAGYLRGKADDHDRRCLQDYIERYRKGELPFIAPLALLQHLISKFDVAYLREQVFFGPFPITVGSQERL